MNYYSKLLSALLTTICGNPHASVVALEGWRMDPQPREADDTSSFVIPTSLLPAGTLVKSPTGCEDWAEAVSQLATQAGSAAVFAVSPVTRLFRDLEVAEIIAESLLGEPRFLPNRLLVQEDAQAELWDTPPTLPRPMEVPPLVDCVVLLVPRKLVWWSRSEEWRKDFFPNHSVTIIEHDHSGVPEALGIDIRPELRFSTIVFQRGAGPVRFVKITENALEDGAESIAEDVSRLLRQDTGKTRYGFVCTDAFEAKYPSYDYHSEEAEKWRREIDVLGERVPLFAVARVLRGFDRYPPQVSPVGEGPHLIIDGRHIKEDGRVETEGVLPTRIYARVRNYLQKGDFCFKSISVNSGRFQVGVFEGEEEKMTVSPLVFIVRPDPGLTPGQRKVLLKFLRSPLCLRLAVMQQRFSSFNEPLRVMPDSLRDLPVPLADLELSSAIEQLEAARAAFVSWIDEVDRGVLEVDEEETATASRMRIISAARAARRRHLWID